MIKNHLYLFGILIILLGIILFETFQQHYYITTYNLADSSSFTFLGILSNHLWRWGVWCVTAIPFYLFIRIRSHLKMNASEFILYSLVMIILVFIDVFIISIIGMYKNSVDLTGNSFSQYLQFFIFQKGPIFLLTYICLAVYSYLHHINRSLTIKIQTLVSAKKSDESSYSELRNNNWNDQTKVLNVRIGKKVKLIPLDDIDWIESDNYCVKIHTTDSNQYTLRISMKKLEEILPNSQFIRIHRAAIVNTERITDIVTGSKPSVILNNEMSLEVSLSRQSLIKDFLNSNNIIQNHYY